MAIGAIISAAKEKPETPTRIRSDVIDIKRKSQVIDFFGNVVVEKDDSSMLAQKMIIFYDEEDDKPSKKKPAEADKSLVLDPKISNSATTADKSTDSSIQPKKSSIRRIDAKENVKIFSEDFIASGDSGYYDPQKNIFVLEQNVIVNNGTSIASGSKFVYNLETKKGNFIGNRDETSILARNPDNRVVVVIGDDLKDQKKQMKKSKNKSATKPATESQIKSENDKNS